LILSRIRFEFDFPIINGGRPEARLYQINSLYSSSGLEIYIDLKNLQNNTEYVESTLQLQNFHDDDSIISSIINFITPKRESDPLTIKDLQETYLYNLEDKNVSSKLYYYIYTSSKVDIYKRYPD
jgi:hypothetical protein